MKTAHFIFCIGTIVLLVVGCATKSHPSKPAIPPVTVLSPTADVHDFLKQIPYGMLGKRLGTRLTIYGEYDYETHLTNALWIDAIDQIYRGAALPIEIRGVQLRKDIHYELQGYEAGEYSGDPDWSQFSDKQPFKYRSFFIVTEVIEPKTTP